MSRSGETESLTISSLLVQARTEDHRRLEEAISSLPGTEVYASTGAGKLVVVIETPGDAELVRSVDRIGALPGVLSVNLVFHHSEPAQGIADPGRRSEGDAHNAEGKVHPA